jgi:signal peptide peptidase SppA
MSQHKTESIPTIGGESMLEESLINSSWRPETSHQRSFILEAFVKTPWAILPRHLVVLNEIVVRHVSGEKLDAEEVQTRIHGAARPASNRRVAAVAVLPLFGTIFPRANMMTQMSGATSAEMFGKEFAALLQDPEVSSIIIDVDSPGGQVDGIEELSNQIFDARGQKPVVAVVDHLMASAAYWIGTAADEVVMSPSGEAGSIGVFAVHQDVSTALQQAGIKVNLISAGKYKTEGNPYEPLAEEARGAIQSRVNEYYDSFVNAIARNRGTSPDAVRNGFGEGRVVGARQAVALGMADRVGTLEETIDRMLGNSGQAGLSQANLTVNGPHALESSNPANADFEHEAQRLRDFVQIFK